MRPTYLFFVLPVAFSPLLYTLYSQLYSSVVYKCWDNYILFWRWLRWQERLIDFSSHKWSFTCSYLRTSSWESVKHLCTTSQTMAKSTLQRNSPSHIAVNVFWQAKQTLFWSSCRDQIEPRIHSLFLDLQIPKIWENISWWLSIWKLARILTVPSKSLSHISACSFAPFLWPAEFIQGYLCKYGFGDIYWSLVGSQYSITGNSGPVSFP